MWHSTKYEPKSKKYGHKLSNAPSYLTYRLLTIVKVGDGPAIIKTITYAQMNAVAWDFLVKDHHIVKWAYYDEIVAKALKEKDTESK